MIQWKRVDASAGALANDEIDAKIFHGGIENFFDGGLQAMDFVEKENFFAIERSENGGEVAFAFEQWTGAGLDGNVQFIGDDLGESGFAQSRRAIEQDVIEGFTTAASGFNGDGNIFFDALLAYVFVEALGANGGVETRIIVAGGTGNDAGGAFAIVVGAMSRVVSLDP